MWCCITDKASASSVKHMPSSGKSGCKGNANAVLNSVMPGQCSIVENAIGLSLLVY